MMVSPGLAIGKLGFQISPIILTGGLAPSPLGMLPIMVLTEAFNLVNQLVTGSSPGLDSFFAYYEPMPGATLVANQIGQYPFANQTVAANAIISQPLSVSMKMICPVREEGGYFVKLAAMMTLQAALEKHNNSGGTYTIITPTYIYTDCLMTGMRDITSGEAGKQPQAVWQLDFVQPLVSLKDAGNVLNSLASKLTSGSVVSGSAGGVAPAAAASSGSTGMLPTGSPGVGK